MTSFPILRKALFGACFFFLLCHTVAAQSLATLRQNLLRSSEKSAKPILDKILAQTLAAEKKEARRFWEQLLRDTDHNAPLKLSVFRKYGDYLHEKKMIADKLSVLEAQIEFTRNRRLYNETGIGYLMMAEVYQGINKPDKQLKAILGAKDVYEKLQDKKGLYHTYFHLGNFYCMRAPDKSILYAEKAHTLRQYAPEARKIISNLNTIALAYQTLEQKKEALKRYEIALKEAIQHKDLEWEGIISGNMAMIYFQEKNYDKALLYLLKDYKYSADTGSKANAAYALAAVYMQKGNRRDAQAFLDSGLAIVKDSKVFGSLLLLHTNYQKLCEQNGDIAGANYHLKKMYAYRDSAYRQRATTETVQIQAQYNFDKQAEEISFLHEKSNLQTQNLQQQRIINYIVAAFIFAMLVLGYFLYRNNQKTKKLNSVLKVQKNEILVQNEELLQTQEELASQRDYAVQTNHELEETYKILEHKEELMRKSIAAARTIQQAILPYRAKLDRLLKDYFVIYQPKDVVSGDFYWLNEIDGTTILIVADCTGHGVPGAFMTLIGANLLDKIIRVRRNLNPAAILEELHREVQIVLKQRYTDNQNGMDVAVLAYQKNNAQTHLTFAGAKINLLYYLTETADFHHVKGTRKSIGGAQEHYITFDNYDLVLPQGTCLYIGSDGLADQNNVRRERFKPSRIEKILADNVSHPMFYQQTCLEESLLAYMTGTVQRDDILFMGVRL